MRAQNTHKVRTRQRAVSTGGSSVEVYSSLTHPFPPYLSDPIFPIHVTGICLFVEQMQLRKKAERLVGLLRGLAWGACEDLFSTCLLLKSLA